MDTRTPPGFPRLLDTTRPPRRRRRTRRGHLRLVHDTQHAQREVVHLEPARRPVPGWEPRELTAADRLRIQGDEHYHLAIACWRTAAVIDETIR